MDDIKRKIEEVNNLLRLKDKAEVIKLELLTTAENKRQELLSFSESSIPAIYEKLPLLDNIISEYYENISNDLEEMLSGYMRK